MQDASHDSLPNSVQNYNCIDLVKFICSILVVVIHVSPLGEFGESGMAAYLNYGLRNYLARTAVPFFFAFSGFFLYKKTDLAHFSLAPTKRYALRLLRLYVLWTLIYFPLAFRLFVAEYGDILPAALNYLRYCIVSGSYTQLWYLPATIFSVLLISLLLHRGVRPRGVLVVASVFYVIGLFAQSWFGLITPLREAAPSLWAALSAALDFIVTTRDGLFEGFLFVGIGMFFALRKPAISKRASLIGLLVSMLLLLLEAIILKHFDLVRGCDVYLFLVPVTFFGFSLFRQIKLPDSAVYPKLRVLSTLIFFLHLWVRIIVSKLLRMLYAPLAKTPVRFAATLLLTIAASLIIMKLSESQKFRRLKHLYT